MNRNTLLKLVASFAAGAAIMYYLDPATGRRRRALVRDQSVAARHEVRDFARAKTRRAANRMRGALAKTRSKISPKPLDDDRLHEQIRSRLGRVVNHPGMIEVQVQDGHVVLRGSALREEIDAVSETVATMRGVKDVDNRMMPELPGDEQEARGVQQQARHQAFAMT